MAGSIGEAVRDIYRHWAHQDINALVPYLAQSFCLTIHLPLELSPYGGVCVGRNTVVDRLEALLDDFKVLRYRPGPVAVAENMVAAEIYLRYRHKPSGVMLETVAGHFWTFEKGLAVALVEYHDVERIAAFMARSAAVMDARTQE